MLVVGRKCGESIRIGKDIKVTVIKGSSGGVRLLVEAPKDIPISRDELFEQYKDKFE